MRIRKPTKYVCPNQECNYYGKEEGKNIIRRGRNVANRQRYTCLHCNRIFVESRNTVLFYSHMDENDLSGIFSYLIDGKSVRSIASSTGHHPDTIHRILRKLPDHKKNVNIFLFNRMKIGREQMIRFWTIITNDPEEGADIANIGAQFLEKVPDSRIQLRKFPSMLNSE